jgi:hypothetical protein
VDDQQKAVDILRLAEDQVRDIGRELNREDDGSKGADRRKEGRFSYIVPEGITVEVESLTSGSGRFYRSCPRNISRGGMAFLHGGFIHPGTRCQITLIAIDDEKVTVRATVRACRYIRGKVHHVGVEFETPVNVEDFSYDAAQSIGIPSDKSADSGVASLASNRIGPSRELLLVVKDLQALSQAANQLIRQIHARLVDFDKAFGTHLRSQSQDK